MTIPFSRPSIGDEEIAEVVACLRSGWLTSGPRTAQFEKEFAAAVQAPHALAVSSATAGLHLAMLALRLPANERESLRRELMAAPAAERDALIREWLQR